MYIASSYNGGKIYRHSFTTKIYTAFLRYTPLWFVAAALAAVTTLCLRKKRGVELFAITSSTVNQF